MITINSPEAAYECVALARELQACEGLSWRDAFIGACTLLPALLADIQADATYRPCRVVWMDGDGRPTRVPNLMTAEELTRFTNRRD